MTIGTLSDVVYACVPGKLWSDSAERGVYRSADGGKTWRSRNQGMLAGSRSSAAA